MDALCCAKAKVSVNRRGRAVGVCARVPAAQVVQASGQQ